MKVKLTEKQYVLLTDFINEAKKPLAPQKLWKFFNNNPNTAFFSVTRTTKDNKDKIYAFKLSKVKGKQTIEDLNQGNATKGCSTEVNFDKLIFGNQLILNFTQCKKRLTLDNITSIGVYDDEQSLKSEKPKDTFQIGGSTGDTTNTTNTTTGDTTNDNSEELKQEAKKAMDMILNDPMLKKAFYTQPSLWNLFVAELKGEKATGKGIVPTLKIVNGYETNFISDKLGAEFIEDEKISFKPFEDAKIPFFKDNKEFTFPFDKNTNLEYRPIVMARKLGEGFKIKGKLEDYLGYELEIIKKIDEEDNIFECRVTMVVQDGNEIKKYPYNGRLKIQILDDDIKSPGYKKKEIKNK